SRYREARPIARRPRGRDSMRREAEKELKSLSWRPRDSGLQRQKRDVRRVSGHGVMARWVSLCKAWVLGVTDTMVDATLPGAGGRVLESIMRTDAPLLTLETSQPDHLVEQFRKQVRHSGEAVYVWREGEGLRSLRDTGMRVPGCLRLVDTLRYVLKS